MYKKTINVGIIGGGLIAREAACSFGKWFTLNKFNINVELVAISDILNHRLDWFRKIPSIKLFTNNYEELLNKKDIDVVYVAVPHNLHEKIYIDVLKSGKDLFAEKPFGIDLNASIKILNEVNKNNRFVRVASQFPFMPGSIKVLELIKNEDFGQILEINVGFKQSGDLDKTKKITWKQQKEFCGEIGVLGDLGPHVLHIPLRMEWKPTNVFSKFQSVYDSRLNNNDELIKIDVPDNVVIFSDVCINSKQVPIRIETKFISPGNVNSWYIEVIGTKMGVKYNTEHTKTLQIFDSKNNSWNNIGLENNYLFPTSTAKIFESGFSDCFLQMWASYISEREGLVNKFCCMTPQEAVDAHKIFQAALDSHKTKQIVDLL